MSASDNDDKRGKDGGEKPYKVGYGRPPLKTQWTKGTSGNPSGGRKRKAKHQTSAELRLKIADELTTVVTFEGKRKRMTVREALHRKEFSDAQKNPKVRSQLLKQIEADEKLLKFDGEGSFVEKFELTEERRKLFVEMDSDPSENSTDADSSAPPDILQ